MTVSVDDFGMGNFGDALMIHVDLSYVTILLFESIMNRLFDM